MTRQADPGHLPLIAMNESVRVTAEQAQAALRMLARQSDADVLAEMLGLAP